MSKHFRTRYSMFKHERHPDWPADCIYAVFDHQTGAEVERGLTWAEAHDTIDELLNANPAPDFDEFPAHERAASAGDMAYQIAKEQF